MVAKLAPRLEGPGVITVGKGTERWRRPGYRTGVLSPRYGRGGVREVEPGLITLSLMLAMAVAALEQTVVSTAMPSIIANLKGLDIYPWVFSAYLLASTVSTPLYGKLADMFGRKRVLLVGLFLFGLGSVLSGFSQTMPQLIFFRVVQGLGAGRGGADRPDDDRRHVHARGGAPTSRWSSAPSGGCRAWRARRSAAC